jgi:DnaJ like chaperone protein
MGWTGKAIGAVAGSAFGPVGAVVGAWIGHNFDQDSAAAAAVRQEEFSSRLNVFACGVCAAYANNELHPNEKKRLYLLARNIFGTITDAEINQHIQSVQQSGFGVRECAQTFAAMHPEAQRSMACEIVSILYADGSGDESEARWLGDFANLSGTNNGLWHDLLNYFEPQSGLNFDRDACLRIFGLSPGADANAIKTAYRSLAREYHPDKLSSIPASVRRLAEEKLKELNAAYEALTKTTDRAGDLSLFAIQNNATSLHGAEDARRGDVTHCFLCGQKNRLPAETSMPKARCGKCYALLLLPKYLFAS